MMGCSQKRWLPLWAAGTLLLVLALGAESHAQQRKKPKPPPPVQQAARQEMHLHEGHVLRQAYILLAMGNHNYAGHRVKAMHQIHKAVEILDKNILVAGTNGQKVVARAEDIAAARAKFLDEHSATVHQPQARSDLQLRTAGRTLANLRGVLVANKQARILGHVDSALQEINIALRIR